MADIQALATKAAERLRDSKDSSDQTFYRISEQVVRGSGISNPSDLKKITGQVRERLRIMSARARSSRAEGQKQAKDRANKISP